MSDTEPSQMRALLLRALERAREAVQIDELGDKQAIPVYGEAVALLDDVVQCLSVESGSGTNREELRRTTSIRDMYKDRMDILTLIHGYEPEQLESSKPPQDEKRVLGERDSNFHVEVAKDLEKGLFDCDMHPAQNRHCYKKAMAAAPILLGLFLALGRYGFGAF